MIKKLTVAGFLAALTVFLGLALAQQFDLALAGQEMACYSKGTMKKIK
jgi:hypothetical protein